MSFLNHKYFNQESTFQDSNLIQISLIKKMLSKKYHKTQPNSNHISIDKHQQIQSVVPNDMTHSLSKYLRSKKSFSRIQKYDSLNLKLTNKKQKSCLKNIRCCNSTKVNSSCKMTKRERKVKNVRQLNISKIKTQHSKKVRINKDGQGNSLSLEFQLYLPRSLLKNSNYSISIKESLTNSPRKHKSVSKQLKDFSKCFILKKKKNKQQMQSSLGTNSKNLQNIDIYLPQIVNIFRSESPIRGWKVSQNSKKELSSSLSLESEPQNIVLRNQKKRLSIRLKTKKQR